MEHDEAHALEDALLDPFGVLIGHFVVGTMAPPSHDVGVVEDLVGETLSLVIELGHAHRRDAGLLFEETGDDFAHSVGIDLLHVFMGSFMHAFVPDRHPKSVFHGPSFRWYPPMLVHIVAGKPGRVKHAGFGTRTLTD